MARTPVTEKPKREPVPPSTIAEKALDEIAVHAADDVHVSRTPVRAVNPVDEDGYRECARDGCSNLFIPKSRNVKQYDEVTEYYCSNECALVGFYKHNGLGTPPQKIVHGAERQAKAGATQQERSAKEDAKAKKYGPLRTITETISRTPHGQKVVLDCGHQGSAGSAAKRARCRVCKRIAEGGVEAPPKRGRKPKNRPVETVNTQSRSVQRRLAIQRAPVVEKKAKRTPVVEKKKAKRIPVKSKRTPVKSPKRGKKGRK